MSKEIADEYASSLADLTVNSKPLINMLTILAEENIEHAGVIVDTVEKHLEKVHPEIKLPVLYLVDSIIKNVGGAYTQKFSQSIVNMFTRTFKQVDEKIRSQMFKLRETWHEVFPATKLYQLDVKVNLIDHAWPIQAQPQQSNIHVNPNFLKKPGATTSSPAPTTPEEDERMRSILAKKEQELLMLQRKKVEMELEQTRRQLELAEKNVKKVVPTMAPVTSAAAAPAQLTSVVTPVIPDIPPTISVKQRLGPPVNKVAGGRIAPVSAALASARRDPRLARRAPPAQPATAPAPAPPPQSQPLQPPQPPIAPNVFDIKPLERVTKRTNVITIDVRPETSRDPRRPPRDPRPLARDKPRRDKPERALDAYIDRHVADPERTNKLPPIPKLPREEPRVDPPPKRRKETRKKHREPKESPPSSEKRRARERKPKSKEEAAPEVVTFKELKNYNKERYMRRNKQKSESPERVDEPPAEPDAEPASKISSYVRARG